MSASPSMPAQSSGPKNPASGFAVADLNVGEAAHGAASCELGQQAFADHPGVGLIGASAIAATITDPKVFRSGRDFAAWIGLVPRQDSTGGKQKLGPISK
jgi:transposase